MNYVLLQQPLRKCSLLAVGASTQFSFSCGRRHSMEDVVGHRQWMCQVGGKRHGEYHVSTPTHWSEHNGIANAICLCDGHGGDFSSQFLCEALLDHLETELKKQQIQSCRQVQSVLEVLKAFRCCRHGE